MDEMNQTKLNSILLAFLNGSSLDNSTAEPGNVDMGLPGYGEIPSVLIGALMFMTVPMTTGAYVMYAGSVVIACIAIVANSCLLSALSKVDIRTLKSKRLIQNSAVSNIALSLSAIANLPFLSYIFKNIALSVQICVSGVYWSVFEICIFIQAICCTGLALDRLYAVVMPLKYHTTGYNKLGKAFMLLSPASISMAIWVGFAVAMVIQTLPVYAGTPTVCMLLYTTEDAIWKSNLFDIMQFVANSLATLIYVAIFFVISYQRRAINSQVGSKVKEGDKTLAFTYFLTTITSVCLYIPAPLYSVMFGHLLLSAGEGRIVFMTTIRGLFLIYLTNSFIDPCILFLRIRSIRQNLPSCCKPTSSKKHSQQSTQVSNTGTYDGKRN